MVSIQIFYFLFYFCRFILNMCESHKIPWHGHGLRCMFREMSVDTRSRQSAKSGGRHCSVSQVQINIKTRTVLIQTKHKPKLGHILTKTIFPKYTVFH